MFGDNLGNEPQTWAAPGPTSPPSAPGVSTEKADGLAEIEADVTRLRLNAWL